MIHHHLVLLCFTIFAFDAAYSQSKVTIKAIIDDNSKNVEFNINTPFVLTCNLSEPGQVLWEKNSKDVEKDPNLKERSKVFSNDTITTFTIHEAKDTDEGTYTCTFIDKNKNRAANDSIVVKQKIIAMKVAKNINVVEGETLKIECMTVGEMNLIWVFENDTHNETYTQSSGRVKLEVNPKNNQTNGILRIDDVQLHDRGDYTCIGKVEEAEVINGTATVRVKDKYAALWPFLGICAEVFVLCAIIFIYEKKRNKTELEESDTDQSPDQKNTPDHGKESNLRHRQ